MTIGLAGVGLMGAAIAGRLMELGHKLVVWNRSSDKAKLIVEKGAILTTTPAALAGAAETVLTSLTDAAAIDAVYGGPSGLLAGDVRGKLFIEMSTVQPKTEVALAEKVRAKSAAFVECPVGGSTGPARAGQLIGLAGAEPADFARAKPLLEQLCRRIEHCGPVGSGSTMKLAINLPLMISWQAFGEAFALCREVGFEPTRLMSLFTDISATFAVLKARAPMLVAVMSGDKPAGATFTIDSAAKDLRIMVAEGQARGLDLPLTAGTMAVFEEANRSGWSDLDVSALAAYWPKRGSR
jgi:3-hydroxyisobutyrate dehydrogenase